MIGSRTVRIDGRTLTDEAALHDVFSSAFGFPSFYGRNWDAWLDCMSSLDEPDFTSFDLRPGQTVVLEFQHLDDVPLSSTLDLLIACADVNARHVGGGGEPRLFVVSRS